jgi:Flp pilus assembly protein TadB
MINTRSFDHQLADIVWIMVTALRAGYSLRQVFEKLAAEAHEPAAGACAQVVADLSSGLSLDQALTNWQKAVPSIYLREVVSTILKYRQDGGNLADMLEPVGEDILARVGTDESLLPMMQAFAHSIEASPPQRNRKK